MSDPGPRPTATATIRMLTRYKAWANELTFATVSALPGAEATRERPTRYGNIVHTLNHVFVVDDIFRAHLEGRPHGHAARNTDRSPPVEELLATVRAMDRWYIDLADRLSEAELAEVIPFEFIGRRRGAMTREEIILHVVNHGTYHRGLVSDMLYQVPVMPPANDLTVFLRDVYRPVVYDGTGTWRSETTCRT